MVKFGKKNIGDGNPVFVTFEAGATHQGKDSAKKLIEEASKAGADAVKFQILDADKLIADKKILFEYDILEKNKKTKSIREPLYDLIKRRMLTRKDWIELKKFADKKNIAFFATPGFYDEIDLLEEIGCDCIKIASGDVNHYPLIKYAARKGICIQLDTGNSTIEEIKKAVKIVSSQGNNNIIIHHNPSGYPARLEGINLNIIKTLKKEFSYPIAFSDHSPGWEMDIAAISLGVNLIEKTITEDRTIKGIEHIFSLETKDLKKFIEIIRNMEIALGAHTREMTIKEEKKRMSVRRSIYLKKNSKKGEILKNLEIEFQRPGYGLSPDNYEKFLNRRLKSNFPAGHLLKFEDFE